jgi:protoheme IX farnesyltransferase
MSDASFALDESSAPRAPIAAPGDYIALLKPRVMSLVVFTALAGLLFAPKLPHPVIAFASLLAIAMGAGASGALNMWYDADIDALMTRTRRRPIPSGRLAREEALAFGLVLAAGSVLTLGLVANWLAAALLAFTIFFYVVVYTMWLKRLTPMNIVIGGVAGALPPIVGFAAAADSVTLPSIVLFAIIFVWTPPHFWALALIKSDEYGRAGVPMLPNVAGPDRTRLEILLYSLLLAPVGLAPYLLGFASAIYGLIAAASGAFLIWLATTVFLRRRGVAATSAAWRLFFFSIAYLFSLFLAMAAERAVHFSWGAFA